MSDSTVGQTLRFRVTAANRNREGEGQGSSSFPPPAANSEGNSSTGSTTTNVARENFVQVNPRVGITISNHSIVPPSAPTNNVNGTQTQANVETARQTTAPINRITFSNQHIVPNLNTQLAMNRPPPLQETPFQSQSNEDRNSNVDENTMKEMECGICYETLMHPSHCGSCSARFCHACFIRAQQQTQTCPNCRKQINSSQEILLDTDFWNKFHQVRVSCKYPNCLQNDILPSQIRIHDLHCGYKPVWCKLKEYGCNWHGPQKDLEAHYNIGCQIRKFESIIESSREQKQLVRVLNARLIQERQMTMTLRNQLMGLIAHDRGVVESFKLIYRITCSPSRFLFESIVWRQFWHCQQTRACMNNFVVLLPMVLYLLKCFYNTLQLLSWIAEKISTRSVSALWANDTFYSVTLEMGLSFCAVMMGALFLVWFIIDQRSCTTWMNLPIQIGNWKVASPSIDQFAFVCVSFFFFVAFDLESSSHIYSNINLKGLSTAILVQLAFFFHPIAEAMLIIGANLQLPEDISKLSTGRAYKVLQNGLIYGALLSFGNGATIEITMISSIKCILAFAKSHPNSFVGKFAEYTRIFEYEQYLSIFLLISIIHGHVLIFQNIMILPSSTQWKHDIMNSLMIDAANLLRESGMTLFHFVIANVLATYVQRCGQMLGKKLACSTLEGRKSNFGKKLLVLWGLILFSIVAI